MRPLLPVRQLRTVVTKASFDKQTNEYDAWFEKNPDIYLAELEAVQAHKIE